MRRLTRRVLQRASDDMLLDLGAEWWDARRAGLVAHQAGDTIRHEAFLSAPNCRFAGVGAAHDFCRAVAVRRERDDLCPPNVLLWAVPIGYDRHKALAIIGFQLDTRTHRAAGEIQIGFNC